MQHIHLYSVSFETSRAPQIYSGHIFTAPILFYLLLLLFFLNGATVNLFNSVTIMEINTSATQLSQIVSAHKAHKADVRHRKQQIHT